MKIELESKSPLFIGSGYEYLGNEIKKEKHFLYRVSIKEILKKMPKSQLLEFILHENYENLENEIQNLKNKYYSECCVYKMELKNDFLALTPNKKIKEFIKINRMPFIPGSTIKGYIRTALMWNLLRHDEEKLSSTLTIIRKKIYRAKKISEVIVPEIDKLLEFKKLSEKRDPKNDFMKFLQITDFVPSGSDTYNIFLDEIKITYVNNPSKIKRSFLAELVEGTFYGEISLSPSFFNSLKRNPDLRIFVSKLLDIDIFDDEKYLNEEVETLILEKIFRICDDFTMTMVKNSKIKKEKYLIRIGAYTGIFYKTILSLIKENDEKLFENMRKKFWKKSLNSPNFPKTLKLTSDNNELGWCVAQITSHYSQN